MDASEEFVPSTPGREIMGREIVDRRRAMDAYDFQLARVYVSSRRHRVRLDIRGRKWRSARPRIPNGDADALP
jgi:hypothetical protein